MSFRYFVEKKNQKTFQKPLDFFCNMLYNIIMEVGNSPLTTIKTWRYKIMMKQEFENLIGMPVSNECYERIEYVYTNCNFFTDVAGKEQIANFYKHYDMNGIERLYRETKEKMDALELVKKLTKQLEKAEKDCREAEKESQRVKDAAEVLVDNVRENLEDLLYGVAE